jgi:hypothetical protein
MIQELQKDDLGFFIIIIRADSLDMANQQMAGLVIYMMEVPEIKLQIYQRCCALFNAIFLHLY